jgi:hypothetical protein
VCGDRVLFAADTLANVSTLMRNTQAASAEPAAIVIVPSSTVKVQLPTPTMSNR